MTDSTENTSAEQTTEQPADGTTPATPETSKRQMSFSLLEDGTIRAEFDGLDALTLDPSKVPETIHAPAMAEGLIGRARAYTGKLIGEARTPAAMRAAIETGFNNLLAGIWKIERAPGADSAVSMEVEAAFLFRKMRAEANKQEYTETIADVATAFAALSDENKKVLKALPRYQVALAQVKAEHAARKLAKLQAAADKEGADAGF